MMSGGYSKKKKPDAANIKPFSPSYFFRPVVFVCESALPATDFDALLNRPSLKILDAVEATGLLVCFGLAMSFHPLSIGL